MTTRPSPPSPRQRVGPPFVPGDAVPDAVPDAGAAVDSAAVVASSPALTLRRELARKAIHVTSAALPVAYALGVARAPLAACVLVLFVTALALELARRRSVIVRAGFGRLVGPLLRAHEHHRLAGATWLLFAFLIALVLYPRAVAIAAMWAVALGDASAAAVGKTVRAWRVRAGRIAVDAAPAKSVAGSAACAIVTAIGALFVAGLPLGASLVAGAGAALAERPSGPGDDNLRVVLGTGAGILLWQMAFSGLG